MTSALSGTFLFPAGIENEISKISIKHIVITVFKFIGLTKDYTTRYFFIQYKQLDYATGVDYCVLKTNYMRMCHIFSYIR